MQLSSFPRCSTRTDSIILSLNVSSISTVWYPFFNIQIQSRLVFSMPTMSTRSPVEFDRRFSYPLLLALAVSLLPGCTISRTFSVTTDCNYKRIKLQKWSQDSAQENGTIRVLLIHGMNNHPFGFAGKPELDGCASYAELQQSSPGI